MIIRLAHVEVGVSDLQKSAEFYCDLLGFHEAERTAEALYLRAAEEYDSWSLKLADRGGPGLVSIGFRVSSPDDLTELEALHDRLGLKHTKLPVGFEPGRGVGLRVLREEGCAIDFHHEIDEVDVYGEGGTITPLARRRGVHVGPSPVALDHVNLRVDDADAAVAYFVDGLEFSISEQGLTHEGRVEAAWLRRTRASHDVAILASAELGCHHFAYTVPDPGSLLRTADLLADYGYWDVLQFGPGRHGVSNAMAMYFLDPDGNRVEFFNGDIHRDLDRPPLTWTPEQLNSIPGGRFWWGSKPTPGFLLSTPYLDAEWPAE